MTSYSKNKTLKKFYLFIYLYYYYVFGCVESSLLHAGFLQLWQAGTAHHCGARALGMRTSAVVARGPSSCGSLALECRLSSCGAWAQLLRGTWDLLRPGLEPVSPALAGRFSTTAPPGKSQNLSRKQRKIKQKCNNHNFQSIKMTMEQIRVFGLYTMMN